MALFLEKNRYHFYIKKRQRRFITLPDLIHFFQRRTNANAAQPQFTQSPEQEMSQIPDHFCIFLKGFKGVPAFSSHRIPSRPLWIFLKGFEGVPALSSHRIPSRPFWISTLGMILLRVRSCVAADSRMAVETLRWRAGRGLVERDGGERRDCSQSIPKKFFVLQNLPAKASGPNLYGWLF